MKIHSARRGGTSALAATLLLGAGLVSAGPVVAAPSDCVTVGGATQVTADCVDATYTKPVIDSQTDETAPGAHRRVRVISKEQISNSRSTSTRRRTRHNGTVGFSSSLTPSHSPP